MGYAIRWADTRDLAALGNLYRRSSLSNAGDRASLLNHPDALIFESTAVHEQRTRVTVADGHIVGFSTLRVVKEVAELEDLFVDPAWMRRGVGTDLVRDVAAIARSHRITRIEVTANEHAVDFYRATGFVLDGTTETRFGSGLRMHLDVAS